MIKKLFLFLALAFFCLWLYAKVSAHNAQPSPELENWQKSAETHLFKNYKISYHDSKTLDKPVIVFLHGFPASSWDWRFLWQALEHDFRLISLDMLGFGLSDKPTAITYTIAEQADIYQSLLDSLSINKAHFVAHDYGDIVSQEFLARQAEGRGVAMQSLTLLNGGIFPEVHEPVFVQKLLNSPIGGLLSQFNSRALFAKNLQNVFGTFSQPTTVMLDDYWFLAVYQNGHQLNHKLLHYIDDRFTFRERWVGATIATKVPMIFINGIADPVSGKTTVDHYINLVPNPQVVQLNGIGHFPHVEAPLLVVEKLKTFLNIQ